MKTIIENIGKYTDLEDSLKKSLLEFAEEIDCKLLEEDIEYHYRVWDDSVARILRDVDSFELFWNNSYCVLEVSRPVPFEDWDEEGKMIIPHKWSDMSVDEIVEYIKEESEKKIKQDKEARAKLLRNELNFLERRD